MYTGFDSFFKRAIGEALDPYPYQVSLSGRDWPDLLGIPTGLGKTASVVLAWLFKRFHSDERTPRRLVYCLPMRVLVEQTAQNARQWITSLKEHGVYDAGKEPTVHVLMGGDLDSSWDMFPEHDQILIGTQDQLLSRALNRGYSMSRYRWPVHFGLMNNDCLWVMDEVQLMGDALATTAQLQAFRDFFKTAYPVRSIWMSATLKKDWLDTVDFSSALDSLETLSLTDEDKKQPAVKQRISASKPIQKAPCQSTDLRKLVDLTLKEHHPGTRTLVVTNTVKRAQALFNELQKKKPSADLVLIHSRFRPGDRKKAMDELLKTPGGEGTICVCTQAIEAGVDVSASVLITELGPWASLIQRFGRCNRDGLEQDARIFWVDIDLDKKGACAPYEAEELARSRQILEKLKDAQPGSLPGLEENPQYLQVIRKKDLVDLFDTTPDLAGMDIDASRFIRDSDEQSLQVFWRLLDENGPKPDEPPPAREELCSVSIGSIASASDLRKWRWDHLEKNWVRVWRNAELFPGAVLFLDVKDGGYSSTLGWTGDKKDLPEVLSKPDKVSEGYDDDFITISTWQSLSDHTEAVVAELKDLIEVLNLSDVKMKEALILAAQWHDCGKAHKIFQEGVTRYAEPPPYNQLWGKTSSSSVSYSRKGFRHELASGLAMMQNNLPDLAVYLVAAHHGKVRLSIRSLPTETRPDQDVRHARGVWDGDVLPEADLGNGVVMPETILDLSVMELGHGKSGSSWLERMIKLRDDPHLGPFRLAYLEALLRIADWRASMNQGSKNE
ncbi:CRISPR-associated helicase Cas3 [Desulfonatronospira thiodismutans ASO3-1]|uniref:CRISPR-associated helicase Cas3 n=1 Tax=Desulfonatronospira thiodismutans ASO3-1 TaxID=555779 RepID=D6STV2_9BACT|nr:CRISPR-associated helicase/endonuclease Cas3 [Desulfonatronospira thiodismutans]EFI34118.1 CRISPR-associated helicase Cas3 [Desulfonatronospira thiodismutans ASO3-1]